ncbi:fatty acid desaturase [Nocardia jejuensis]|uniref:fatty acid desaturase n=1 Tax=Nocardia jejuensis TaxID=328049 RepID=UPI00082CD947|nr:fatty acid desaturase [Nocardia jejuensis]
MTIDDPIVTKGNSPATLLDPRESMRRLPVHWQTPLTMLTGKPYDGQPAIRLSVTHHVAGCCASMGLGVGVTALALWLGTWWIVSAMVGMAVTLHGMRNARMMVFHQAAHKNLYRRERLDAAIGRACSAILLVQNFSQYRREHTSEHHSRHHMTLRDPTVQAFLIGLGLTPGMTRRQMWRRMLRKVLSPAFQLRFAISRLCSFWIGADTPERAIALGFYGSAIFLSVATGSWEVFVIGWLVPLFPLFQIVNTLRLCVKHTFPAPGNENIAGKERMAALTNAIFLGEATPARGQGAIRATVAWTRWCGRMVFVHAPARYLVLTGDTVCHDFHHRYPRHKAWFDYISEREIDSHTTGSGWPEYTQVWGLAQAISHVFDSLARADSSVFDRTRIEGISSRALFTAFDD